ncbi:hypothetical protein Nepgr_031819 [Nepenthes gracilis]|uniref:Non-haem dioxygenase N-terminal domain-containing protein n=1 Tax=Nepenthes gracilis TaxID=150966 RepID=A0AAD3TJ74_NEPGR|nr:hypothetical protein Nepgr_031819 [Nepenthes gracilis]
MGSGGFENERIRELKAFDDTKLGVKVIDLASGRCEEIVNQILHASSEWGLFQVVNHGVPVELLDRMMVGSRLFHEGDGETEKDFYSLDKRKKVKFSSNYDLYKSQTTNWRDTLTIDNLFDGHLDPNDLPVISRSVFS